MKEFIHKNLHFNLRLYFTLIVMAELTVAVLISVVAAYLLYLHGQRSFTLAVFVWVLCTSIVIGGAFSLFVSNAFFKPITGLNRAMEKVAKGDFSLRLESHSRVREVRELYNSFNLMTKELSATEILQTDFVSNVSHEFKTPINAIEGYATLLQGTDAATGDSGVYVDKILYNTQRLSSLVGNILLLSKVDNQVIESQKSVYRLDEQIRQAIVSLEQSWSDKNLDLDVDLEEISYCGNEGLMMHVWTNIIGNAIKFDPEGGLLKIHLTRDTDGRIIASVEDSGPGMTPEQISHIFDKFYQADSSHKAEGNGLGLSLVKRILDTAGGEIKVESESGLGSQFFVILK